MRMSRLWHLSTLLVLLLPPVLVLRSTVDAARILMAPPQISSHMLMSMSIGEELASRGHQVHIAIDSRCPYKETIRQNGMDVLEYRGSTEVYTLSNEWESYMSQMILGETVNSAVDAALASSRLNDKVAVLGYADCAAMMADHDFLDRARGLRFDIAVIEPFVLYPCKTILAWYLGLPLVSFTAVLAPFRIRLPVLPSFYVPQAFNGVPIGSVDTFLDRLQNAAVWIVTNGAADEWETDVTLLRRFAPEIDTWNELVRRSQLFIVDYNQLLLPPLPLLPHVVSAGGCTVKPVKPLPSNLERVFAESVEEGGEGVILVTFGSVLHHMPPKMMTKFLDAFSKLNFSVVMRSSASNEASSTPLPFNVHLVKWLPQNDVLADNRTRLFITHCGVNGLNEAIHYGVPILGFPMFAEQTFNCHRVQDVLGSGRCMDVWNFTADELVSNVREILSEKSPYVDAARYLSARFRDQPMFGRQLAAFWIEHVIKHGGEHLRSPAVSMPIHKFFMLDIFAVGCILFFLLGLSFSASCLLCIKLYRKRSANKSVDKTKKRE